MTGNKVWVSSVRFLPGVPRVPALPGPPGSPGVLPDTLPVPAAPPWPWSPIVPALPRASIPIVGGRGDPNGDQLPLVT